MIGHALAVLLGTALLAACNQSPHGQSVPLEDRTTVGSTPRPTVVASFYPLYEFAQQVAGERAVVSSLVPPGVEPHDWEPAPQDVARVEKARVFVYNGAGFEPWADRLLANLGSSRPAVVVATDGIELLRADLPGHDRDRGSAGQPPGVVARASARDDPHVWLDPLLAQREVEAIRAALAKADPDNAASYTENARVFTERLRALDQRYQRGLAGCARREIVASHASFAYPAKRYRLTEVPIMGLSPESEPSPAQLAQIVRFARRHDVKFIFFETLVSPKLAQTLAREVRAQTLVLNPVEGVTREDQAAGRGYVELMEDNLRNLRTALGCA